MLCNLSMFSISRRVCGVAPPLPLADHLGQVVRRANLERARHRFGIPAIGDGHLAVLPSQAGGVFGALEGIPTAKWLLVRNRLS
jgi:hypothetical protein